MFSLLSLMVALAGSGGTTLPCSRLTVRVLDTSLTASCLLDEGDDADGDTLYFYRLGSSLRSPMGYDHIPVDRTLPILQGDVGIALGDWHLDPDWDNPPRAISRQDWEDGVDGREH